MGPWPWPVWGGVGVGGWEVFHYRQRQRHCPCPLNLALPLTRWAWAAPSEAPRPPAPARDRQRTQRWRVQKRRVSCTTCAWMPSCAMLPLALQHIRTRRRPPVQCVAGILTMHGIMHSAEAFKQALGTIQPSRRARVHTRRRRGIDRLRHSATATARLAAPRPPACHCHCCLATPLAKKTLRARPLALRACTLGLPSQTPPPLPPAPHHASSPAAG